MNDTTDFATISIRMAVFVGVALIFYFVLKSEKKK